MNLFTKMGYGSKAKAIAKRRGMIDELIELDVESVCEKARESYSEDFSLFADLTLYNYYRYPCAYTANNVIALYVDIMNGKEIEECVELPDYEFFEAVGSFLEKGSQVEDVFDAKEYYITLAQYFLMSEKFSLQKAFDVLANIKPELLDEDAEYLIGILYYKLGMIEVAKKVLLTSIENFEGEKLYTSSLVAGELLIEESKEQAKKCLEMALNSNKIAVLTKAVKELTGLECYESVVKGVDLSKIEEWNPELYYCLAFSFSALDKIDDFNLFNEIRNEDEYYLELYEKAAKGEKIDVSEFDKEARKNRMNEIMDSEMYMYADDTTRRMLNNDILEVAGSDTEFEEREYIEFVPQYLK